MIARKKAYVLMFTLSILAFVTILTNQLMRMVFVGSKFDISMVDRERAEMLALGGINLAIAQLTVEQLTEKSEPSAEKENEKGDAKIKKETNALLERVLPHLNRWQEFELDDEIDGINGRVKICISCENGKIDINQAFDFKKQAFKPDYEKLIKTLKLSTEKGMKSNFFKTLTAYLKKRNRKIDDLSELIEEESLSVAKLFYEPPEKAAKPRLSKPNIDLALFDIFTIWNKKEKLEALFLSDGLCQILEFRRPAAHDAEIRSEKFKSVIKNFDGTMNQNEEKYWKIVNPIYEQKSSFKIKNRKIFSSKFEPSVYSVLSSGKVGAVEQQILAIIKKVPPAKNKASSRKKTNSDKETEADQKRTKPKGEKPFKVIRLYWI